MTVDQEKQEVRQRVWTLLEAEHAVPAGAYGKIPDFHDADRTAELLSRRPEWQRARVVKSNPDRAQLPIRVQALEDGKLLYVAVPRMATLNPFYVLDPQRLTGSPRAAVEAGATANATRVGVQDMSPVDLVICGSVAVNRQGVRIGKGAGYSDLEVAILIEAGLISHQTTIVAPVHDLQVLDDDLPHDTHDFTVDLIVTPSEVIACPRTPRPRGLVWANLPQEKIEAIPVLAALAESRRR